MDISFFIVRGVIFATYIALTFWNVYNSNEKQRVDNYPNLEENSKENNPPVASENADL